MNEFSLCSNETCRVFVDERDCRVSKRIDSSTRVLKPGEDEGEERGVCGRDEEGEPVDE